MTSNTEALLFLLKHESKELFNKRIDSVPVKMAKLTIIH